MQPTKTDPKNVLPRSPINTLAGSQLKIKKPKIAPAKGNRKGKLIIAKDPKTIAIQEANIPSIPSIKFIKFIIAVPNKTNKIIKNICDIAVKFCI